MSAEILGGFESKESGPGTRLSSYCPPLHMDFQTHFLHHRYAIVTLDGTVLLVDHGTKDPMDSIMWNLQVRANHKVGFTKWPLFRWITS